MQFRNMDAAKKHVREHGIVGDIDIQPPFVSVEVIYLRGRRGLEKRARGYAKCHPNDVFIGHKGVAIATRRAIANIAQELMGERYLLPTDDNPLTRWLAQQLMRRVDGVIRAAVQDILRGPAGKPELPFLGGGSFDPAPIRPGQFRIEVKHVQD